MGSWREGPGRLGVPCPRVSIYLEICPLSNKAKKVRELSTEFEAVNFLKHKAAKVSLSVAALLKRFQELPRVASALA